MLPFVVKKKIIKTRCNIRNDRSPPCGVLNVTVLLMSPSLAPFSTTTPAVMSENGHRFAVASARIDPSLRLYLRLSPASTGSVGCRHGDHS